MAAETLVLVMEDVLTIQNNRLDRHLAMYRGLATEFRTVILTTMDRDEAKRILRTNQVRYDVLLDKGDSVLTDVSWKVAQVRECLGLGWPIGIYLDVDPDAIRQVYSLGVSALLLTHHLLRPSWLPSEGPPRAWEELVSAQEDQHQHTIDTRYAEEQLTQRGLG